MARNILLCKQKIAISERNRLPTDSVREVRRCLSYCGGLVASCCGPVRGRARQMRVEMRCPKCGYERQVTDVGPDLECPACGVVYSKVASIVPPARIARPEGSTGAGPSDKTLDAPRQPPGNRCSECGGRMSQRATACPHCGDPNRRRGSPADQPVSITDVSIPFWSMVRLMIKWALATIPAILLLFVILMGIAVVLGATGATIKAFLGN